MATSVMTIRRRLLRQFKMGDSDIEALTREIAVLRVAAYEGRLQQVADELGLDLEPRLTDDQILRRITRESKTQAKRLAQTYNDALYSRISAIKKGATQRAEAQKLRDWTNARSESKARTIARVEGMIARDQADRDILLKNKITGISLA